MSSDLLTELQRQLRDVNDQFAIVIEQLIHIAPPAPLEGDSGQIVAEEPSAVSHAELQVKALELSKGIAQRFKDINTIISKLPDAYEPPEKQDARIGVLLHEHHALRKELGLVMQEAERKLEEIHGCYEAIAQHTLRQAGKMGTSNS
ncbi:hypothetical protein VOLCADRAFT_102882 [Volvox carteri f. nagariensis]|uniref:Mediator of RNA polymerase II transcription subunit 21 n=1 Tax=Volvox carteri f. nagariensis TaxID=3068 RepID=D8TIP7_VOLCA|nr:uncharacterized protein VOLCADRAFT_102882 [Volvox carteri f. nagariensis]EFJ52925.1 hypothetical protein VOLCADRAFT_102882 [Volvox carteri f. nagariensis]|eukprot:XP_002945930.1 hypothetical protein VOLCADRAFT_102882 [Volvox carteri f. nagariensis]